MTATRSGFIAEPLPRQPIADREQTGQLTAGKSLQSSADATVLVSPSRSFAFWFSPTPIPDVSPHVGVVPLRVLTGGGPVKLWAGTESGPLDCAGEAADEHIVVHARVPAGPGPEMAGATLGIYRELLTQVATLRYPHLVRVWNFVPSINHGASDDETYAQFNHGRAAAFDQFGLRPGQYPAATAVGSPPGTPLAVVILASRIEPLAIENPRQVSAYHYPRQYGPRPPAFARAMMLPDRARDRLFVSGTSSIVGHQSQHGNVQSQLLETLANLERLMGTVAERLPGTSLGKQASWRVYLRDPADLDLVQAELTGRLGNSIAFVQADICRRELRLEIEGVCELVGPGDSPRS